MPLTRPTFLSTAFLLHCLCWLVLATGLVLPAAARTTRTNRTHSLRHKHLRRHAYLPRMLPTIIPAAREGYATILRGRASWYGKFFQGMKTTSGERFNRFKYTCAHKTLPFGTRLRVTNVSNGATVVVRVTDRGPFRHQRIIDLAEVAARPLGLVNTGAATVVAEVVPATTPLGLAETPDNLAVLKAGDPNPQAPFTAYLLPETTEQLPFATATPPAAVASAGPLATTATPTQFVVQAGTFTDAASARAMQAHILALDQALPATVVTATVDGQLRNRVVVGQLDSWLAAETVRRNLQLWGITGIISQLPTPATDPAATSTIASALAATPTETTALRR
ncbi:septal ring lytic transglycosylase RlpA family protein [Hymenobacter ginkgonis]|uniref:septal ring lytic transglycosylase RlpA family protein n=1 Tax=Hymenobacter ginkgonis TaxID=2682976 RepID=UPI0018DC5168|nr:septal ring lytic transglycosylase RlpA family protein [Hymenobacter ginkgonis]